MASERKAKADLRTFLAANEANLAIKAAAKEQQQKVRLAVTSPAAPRISVAGSLCSIEHPQTCNC